MNWNITPDTIQAILFFAIPLVILVYGSITGKGEF